MARARDRSAAFQNFSGRFQAGSGLVSAPGGGWADLQPTGALMKTLTILASLICATPALATTYTLEPDYTQVLFSWDHLGFSHPTAQIAQGTGTLEFDPMQPTMASLQVTLPVGLLTTGVPGLDEHLKSEDFFDLMRFPQATFVSTRVVRGGGEDRLGVTGNLTV